MKKLTLAALLAAAPLAAFAAPPAAAPAPATKPAAAAPAKPDPLVPVHQFLDTFNSGDMKAQYDAYAPGSVTLIDEFPPHVWTGPKASVIWPQDYDKHAKAFAVTDPKVVYSAPIVATTSGSVGYVVIPVTYSYKSHGTQMSEEASMTFALTLTKAGYKIRAWSYNGIVPHTVK